MFQAYSGIFTKLQYVGMRAHIWSYLSRFKYIQNPCITGPNGVNQHLLFKSGSSFKGATKSHFTHYLCVVVILFNTALYMPAFSTDSHHPRQHEYHIISQTRFKSFLLLKPVIFEILTCILTKRSSWSRDIYKFMLHVIQNEGHVHGCHHEH